jgi:hypothetical protein
VQASIKERIDAALKGCPSDAIDDINTKWNAITITIGTGCSKRFDVIFYINYVGIKYQKSII